MPKWQSLHFIALLVFLCSAVGNPLKHDFHSFEPPFSTAHIPYWKFGGTAGITEDLVRLTTTSANQLGWIYNLIAVQLPAWSVTLTFKITGPSRQGADGLAFWYVDKPQNQGPVFGHENNWQGLGVFFDTFDNDGKNDNPYIGVVMNDGSKSYFPHTDGAELIDAGCRINLRNLPQPVKAFITYRPGSLSVQLDVGSGLKPCAQVEATLPTGFFFKLSALTGALFDRHEVISFETFEIPGYTVPDQQETRPSVNTKPSTAATQVPQTQKQPEAQQISAPSLNTPLDKQVQEILEPQLKSFLEKQSTLSREKLDEQSALFRREFSEYLKKQTIQSESKENVDKELQTFRTTVLQQIERNNKNVERRLTSIEKKLSSSSSSYDVWIIFGLFEVMFVAFFLAWNYWNRSARQRIF